MGVTKRPHVAALMALPRVAADWAQRHGRALSEANIDAIYAAFVPKTSPSRRVMRWPFRASRRFTNRSQWLGPGGEPDI